MTCESPSSDRDEQLARRARQGCAASFEQLMRRYQAPVLHFLRHRGGGADAEDLLQETFLRVYSNLHRYRPQWQFATWVFTIARRVSINHHRRRRPQDDGRAIQEAVCPRPGPPEAAAAAESRRNLWSAAAEVLSEEQVTALWLYYVEELPAREIARVLDRSWVSVKTMLFRARKKLLPLAQELQELDAGQRRRREGDCPDFRATTRSVGPKMGLSPSLDTVAPGSSGATNQQIVCPSSAEEVRHV